VTENPKEANCELAEVKWSLRATTKDLDKLSVLRPGRMIEEERDQLRSNLNNQLSQDTRTIHELQQQIRQQDQWIKTLTVQKKNQEFEIEQLQDGPLAKENTELQKTIDFLQDEAEEGNNLSDKQVQTIEELKSTIIERDATIKKLQSRSSLCTCRAGGSASVMVGIPTIPQSDETGHTQTPSVCEKQVDVAPTRELDAGEEERDYLRAQLDRQASEINQLHNLPEQCDIEQISAESAERFEKINDQEWIIKELRNLRGRANELDHENQVQNQILDLDLVIEDQDNSLYWTTQARWFLEDLQAEALAGQVSLMRSFHGMQVWRWEQYGIVDLSVIDDQCAQARTEDDSQRTPDDEISHNDEPRARDTMMGTEQDGVGESQPPNGEACDTGNRMTGAGDAIMGSTPNDVGEPQRSKREAYGTVDRMMGTEDNGHAETESPNDNESEAGDEVADSSIYEESEAGDVVMGHVNDEDVSHTANPPDIADSDLNGLVDDLAHGIEQLNNGRDLLNTAVPSLIGQDGLAHGNSPYWAMVNNPPYKNCFLSADDGSWGSKAVEEYEEEL